MIFIEPLKYSNARALGIFARNPELQRLRWVWWNMWGRCTNPENPRYAQYGGRGITVTTDWECFETFVRDMKARPSKQHQIDRLDADKNYTKDNRVWATVQEQTAVGRRTWRTNKTGITGVQRKSGSWYTTLKGKGLYYGKDLFEACCVRKAAENLLC